MGIEDQFGEVLSLCTEGTPREIIFLVEAGNKLAPRRTNAQSKQGSSLHAGSHCIYESSHHAKTKVQSKEHWQKALPLWIEGVCFKGKTCPVEAGVQQTRKIPRLQSKLRNLRQTWRMLGAPSKPVQIPIERPFNMPIEGFCQNANRRLLVYLQIFLSFL